MGHTGSTIRPPATKTHSHARSFTSSNIIQPASAGFWRQQQELYVKVQTELRGSGVKELMHSPQVIRVLGFEQVLRARAFLFLEEDVVFGVAVGADGAVLAAAAPGGLALQLYRQGDVVDVV